MLVALGTLASAQSSGTDATARAIIHLLNYCATHPDAILRYHASDMHLHIHSEASSLFESHDLAPAATTFSAQSHPTTAFPNSIPAPPNGAVHTHCSIMSVVLSSATEAETGATFHNAQDGVVLRNILNDLGHPQGATPIQTDNACAAGILNDTVKQRRSKAMDMRFYWVKDRVRQGQFTVHWRRGADNRADYFTKHHPPAHHRLMRSHYVLDPLPSTTPHSATTHHALTT